MWTQLKMGKRCLCRKKSLLLSGWTIQKYIAQQWVNVQLSLFLRPFHFVSVIINIQAEGILNANILHGPLWYISKFKAFLYTNFLDRCVSFWSIWTFSGSASSCPHWVSYSGRSTCWPWQVPFQLSFSFPKITQYSWTVFLISEFLFCNLPLFLLLVCCCLQHTFQFHKWYLKKKKLQVKP